MMLRLHVVLAALATLLRVAYSQVLDPIEQEIQHLTAACTNGAYTGSNQACATDP